MPSIIINIINFLKNLNRGQILIGLCILSLGFGALQFVRAKDFKAKYEVSQSNIKALKDSVQTYENKAGELTYEKRALQADKKDLALLNETLSKELNKERDEIKSLQRLVTELKNEEPIVIEVPVVEESPGGKFTLSWTYEDQGDDWYKKLSGYTEFIWDSTLYKPTFPKTVIVDDILRMAIITGIKEVDGDPRIFVRSTYPGIRFTNIDGAIVDPKWFTTTSPKPKRWGIGVQLGYGLGINDNQINTFPYIGAGISYNLIRF